MLLPVVGAVAAEVREAPPRALPAAREESATPPVAPPSPGAAADDCDRPRGLAGFDVHRPNYFLTGFGNLEEAGGAPDAKIQFSIRYDLVTDSTRRWRLTLAYTQKALWDIYARSSPFRETNYDPEGFAEWDARFGSLRRLSAGYEHESNGLAEDRSRSWDRAVVRAHFALSRLEIEPTAWVAFNLDDNGDLLRSYGHGELLATVALGANSRLDFTARVGSHFGRAGAYLGVDVDLPHVFGAREGVVWNWFTPHLFAQAWHGYGETLVQYDVRTTALRAGIVVRR